MWSRAGLAFFLVAVAASAEAQAPQVPSTQGTSPKGQAPVPYCFGTYADDANAISLSARRLEQSTRYTFCVRSTAIYQCLSYDREGNMRKRRENIVAHGTAFAFRRAPGFTYLLTNEHLSEWPLVSDGDQEEVPAGCKRINQSVSIVDDDKDEYEADDIPLTRVVIEPELDATILRAPAKLPTLPLRLGQSSALRAGNAVQVRGFPLGAFYAVNLGKIITAHDRDMEKHWDHNDFVIDALLSQGNSGSPVLAVSCRTHELELVGMYHAGYREGSALNVVVGIDELRDIMTTLRPRKRRAEAKAALTAKDRGRLVAALQTPGAVPVLPFGGFVLGIRPGPAGTLFYELFSREYPLSDRRLFILEDIADAAFGRIGRIWFGSPHGLLEYSFAELEQQDQTLVSHAATHIRLHALRVTQFRNQQATGVRSRSVYERLLTLERQLNRSEASRKDLARALAEASTRYSPDAGDDAVSIQAVLSAPRPTAATNAAR